MSPKPSISAFFPVLNDWGTVGSLVLCTLQTLEQVASDYEVILVDDGSDASTRQVLGVLAARFEHVRVIRHDRNRGYGAALRTGIAASRCDLVFYTDTDAQYDPRELADLVARLDDTVDVVNGYKVARSDPWYRVVIGALYNIVVKTLFRLPIREIDTDFRLMRRSIFDAVRLESNSGVICAEMITKIHRSGFRFAEVPVHHYWRTSGKSQFFNLRRVAKSLWDLLRLWYQLTFREPVRPVAHHPCPSTERLPSGVC